MAGPVLQTLLEERFQLKVHRETKELPVFVLTVVKSGLKMPRTKEGNCQPTQSMRLAKDAKLEPDDNRHEWQRNDGK